MFDRLQVPGKKWSSGHLFAAMDRLIICHHFAHKIRRSENTEFGDFFKGFDHIGQLALTALVQSLIILGSMIPFFFIAKDSGLSEWYMEYVSEYGSFADLPYEQMVNAWYEHYPAFMVNKFGKNPVAKSPKIL